MGKNCPKCVQDVSKMLVELMRSKEGCLDIPTMMNILGEKSRRLFTRKSISPALRSGLIEMTIPDKPTSRYQQYRLTNKGQQLLKKSHE